jgi:hypothetical protein
LVRAVVAGAFHTPRRGGTAVQATRQISPKVIAAIGVNVPIALLHFVTGSHYKGPFPVFVNGYMLNILIPFGFYFLLCLIEHRLMRHWFVRGILIFGAASAVEIAQGFGVALLGETFDPLDFVMYGVGVILAAILDVAVLPRIFKRWASEGEARV